MSENPMLDRLEDRLLDLEYLDLKERLKGSLTAGVSSFAIDTRGSVLELRTAMQKPEIRTQNGKPTIEGYAVVWNALSEDLGGFKERILQGAFSRSLLEHPDVKAYVEHDPKQIIGRTTGGTLSVREDSKGLAIKITPPDTSAGRDALENIRSGILSQMSFGFSASPGGVRWSENHSLREVLMARLYEVSIVSLPAYPQTSVHARVDAIAKRLKLEA